MQAFKTLRPFAGGKYQFLIVASHFPGAMQQLAWIMIGLSGRIPVIGVEVYDFRHLNFAGFLLLKG